MEKNYLPHAFEQKLYQLWEKNGYFKPQPGSTHARFCMVIPPPNVTGTLHMGHAFQQTLMDALIRYHRMQGKQTLWQVGTDHAGIATQLVVERHLAATAHKNRHDYSRDDFVKHVWDWKETSGRIMTQQMRRLGLSVDWTQERFTLDASFCKAVQVAFVRLYRDQLIVRGKRLVNWDPKLQTAISDLEVEMREVEGKLWYLRYPLPEKVTTLQGAPYLVVATTRPETLLGDSALAVHPHDERYQHLIGHQVAIPLLQRTIPIIADVDVDPAFGSGVVKITPAHDFNDHTIGKRHRLPMITIFTLHATVRAQTEAFDQQGAPLPALSMPLPTTYVGLDRSAARKKIVEELSQHGLLEQTVHHVMHVPYGDRSGVVIEPLLTDQWYIRTAPLTQAAIDAVKRGAIQLIPKQYENLYLTWMNNLQDWCISRQLWWGHRIPAWYDAQGNVFVGHDEAEVRAHYQLPRDLPLTQEVDVLDTWFSSALWSFASLGWPDLTPSFSCFHPTDALITGFDILFFWVARMIMLTGHLLQAHDGSVQIPFRQVYITGLIRDEQGQKMSKSKGNVIDPLDMIDGITLDALVEKRTEHMMHPQREQQIRNRTRQQFPQGIQPHGTDALRFTLVALASTGRDIHWDMQRLAGYRNFCNKLWNASRFVLLQCANYPTCIQEPPETLSLADRWIISELQHAIQSCRTAFDSYRFDIVAHTLHDFIWNTYCNWYLEIAKPLLRTTSLQIQQATRHTLLHVLEVILRLAHPVIPFITEAIWLELRTLLPHHKGETIMLQPYPSMDPQQIDAEATTDLCWLQRLIVAVRNLRAEQCINPQQKLTIFLRQLTPTQQILIEQNRLLVATLAYVEEIIFLSASDSAPTALTQLLDQAELLLPLQKKSGRKKEAARLTQAIHKLESAIRISEAKLANSEFVTRAPHAVVHQERIRLQEHQQAKERLHTQYTLLTTVKPATGTAQE